MMRLPTSVLGDTTLSRIILSIGPSGPPDLMKKVYGMGVTHFDLPSRKHLDHFRELRGLTEDESLLGLGHLDVEAGISFTGKPLHLFEARVVATIRKNLNLPPSARHLPAAAIGSDVLTQKEIDRLDFDLPRFEQALSCFHPEETPFLLVGERYGDWLLALGRVDLLHEIMAKVRARGFRPIYSGQWATFSLPKAKVLDVVAYAVPINRKWSLFSLQEASDLIKRFDRPVISLNALADGKLLKEARKALLFLFQELKITSAIAEIHSLKEAELLLKAAEGLPSLIPPRRT